MDIVGVTDTAAAVDVASLEMDHPVHPLEPVPITTVIVGCVEGGSNRYCEHGKCRNKKESTCWLDSWLEVLVWKGKEWAVSQWK